MSETEVTRVPRGPATTRRAQVRISADELASLLDLPAGLSVRNVTTTWDPRSVVIVVEGETLAEVSVDCESPVIPGHWERRQIVGDDGLRYMRFGWQPEDDARVEIYVADDEIERQMCGACDAMVPMAMCTCPPAEVTP